MADHCTEVKFKNKGILRLGDILTLSDYKLKSWDQMKRMV